VPSRRPAESPLTKPSRAALPKSPALSPSDAATFRAPPSEPLAVSAAAPVTPAAEAALSMLAA